MYDIKSYINIIRITFVKDENIILTRPVCILCKTKLGAIGGSI